MHLPELPTIFVKGGEERKVYFTVQARELIALGWKEKGTEEKEPVKAAELKAETVKAEPKTRAAKAKVEFIEEDK